MASSVFKMASLSEALTELPCMTFLTAYPHPLFVLHAREYYGQTAPSLSPVFGNAAFRTLVFGTDADTADLGVGFLRSLRTAEQAQNLGDWLLRGHTSNPLVETHNVDVTPAWREDITVTLELSQTVVEGFLICTSSPRTPLPVLSPASTPSSDDSLSRRRGQEISMHLPGFPPSVQTRASSRSPPYTYPPVRLTDQVITKHDSPSVMRQMVENHPWHLTPLGPREQWSSSLRTVVSYIMASPFPISIWWGPEVVLIYNDAYMEMAGSKHPRIFGESGSVSWGELWEDLGPLAHKALTGESIARHDDLLFFSRLTGANLPEEVYHNWSFVPVQEEDGSYGGLLNNTFDTTSKVLAERRFLFLRDLSNQAATCRTQADFWNTVIEVVKPFTFDVPFAAFYSVHSDEPPVRVSGGPHTSYIRGSEMRPPIKVSLRRAGTVGIPESHRSTPPYVELLLDPLTLFPSPETKPEMPSDDFSPQDEEGNLLVKSDGTSLYDQLFCTESDQSLVSNEIRPHSVFGTANSYSSGTAIPGPGNANGSGYSSDTVIHTSATHRSTLWPFEEAFGTRRAVRVENIPDYVVEGFDVRGWGEPAREAVVIPINADNDDLPSAVLIWGVNSRRPYDRDYEDWIDLTRLSLNSLLKGVKGREADAIRADTLAELDSAKTTFFSNASHELRTPLTLIKGPLNDCIELVADKKVKESLKMASRNVVRLARLVDSLMDFSKIAANRLEGHFRPVSLGPYTADLASLFRSVIEKNQIEYVVDCDMNDRRLSYIDPDFWEKVVFNLIGNAFKYTMRGCIRVLVEYDREHSYLHVQDTGVGIPQADIGKIFERFHRVEAMSRSHEGTGIGLALTRELVKLHGGTLTVQSKSEAEFPDDHGSTFTVLLPLGKDHLPTAHVVSESEERPQNLLYAKGVLDEATAWDTRAPEERTPSESSDSGASNEGRKIDSSTLFFSNNDIILLADDNADMRRYISSLFSPYCKVLEARNGLEALQIVEKVKPNLVLSDVMMPGLDGFGLIQQLRQRSDTKLTPIILVTARESEENKVEGLLSGADDYMSKPFTGKELIARVHLQMQIGKRRIELEEKFLERTREIQLLSDLSPVGIVRVDEQGSIVYTNSTWWDVNGLEQSENPSEWLNCVVDENKTLVVETWKSAVKFQQSSSIEFRLKNGKYAKAYFEPLFSDAGKPRGMLGTLTDISDQKLLEVTTIAHAEEREGIARKRAEEAEQRRQDADERRSAQELLIDVTSHELRQPVSAILNCSSLVRSNLSHLRDILSRSVAKHQSFVPSQQLIQEMDDDLEALDAIYQCGLAQERIANDVLSLSRIQLNVLTIQHVEFDVVEEVRSLAGVFKNELKMKRIILALSFGDSFSSIGSTILSDKSRFVQVITNLLSNAIKFTDTSATRRNIDISTDISRFSPEVGASCVPPETEPGDAREATSPLDVYIYVSVKDSGPGIKSEDLRLLFQRFQQGSYSHNVFGGSGLGLFVSKQLCEMMGGRIDVDSTYGEGATFRFFIRAQLGTAHVSEADGPSIQGTSGSTSAVPRLSSPTQSMHVLLTEDNLINQRVLSRQLRQAGCTVDVASNGQQALDAIRALAGSDGTSRRAYDIILMDCEMPVMDGLSAVRDIRKQEASGLLPHRNRVIALTGNARAGQIQSARDAGMDDVMIKPYKLDELLKKMQSRP